MGYTRRKRSVVHILQYIYLFESYLLPRALLFSKKTRLDHPLARIYFIAL